MKGLIVSLASGAFAAAALAAWRKADRKERASAILNGEDTRAGISPVDMRARLRCLASLLASRRGKAATLASVSLAIFLLTRNPFLSAAVWPAAAAFRRLAQRHRRARSMARLEEQALEFIDSLNQSLRSGLSLLQSLEAAREDVGEELGSEVERVLGDVNLGAGLEKSLSSAAGRAPSSSLRITFTVLALLHGKGGDLPRILERLRRRVQEGLEVRRETRMLTSQSRASGYLVASLPLAFLLLQGILNPRSLRPLLATPAGNAMVAVAVALNVGAFLIIRRLVNPGS